MLCRAVCDSEQQRSEDHAHLLGRGGTSLCRRHQQFRLRRRQVGVLVRLHSLQVRSATLSPKPVCVPAHQQGEAFGLPGIVLYSTRQGKACKWWSTQCTGIYLEVRQWRGWPILAIACRQDLLQRAVQLAREAGAKVALDLASFEVVREFRTDVEALIESKHIECCFCNEVGNCPCGPVLLQMGVKNGLSAGPQ